jgi:hypothetical protein
MYILIAVEVLGIATIMIYVASDPYNTIAHIRSTYMELPLTSLERSLDGYFRPLERTLTTALVHAKEKRLDIHSSEDVASYFIPVLEGRSYITSMGVADDSGYEYDILKGEGKWLSRKVDFGTDPLHCHWKTWPMDDGVDSTWTDSVPHDPRTRPWYSGAVSQQGGHFWSEPYLFNTTGEYGITLSGAFTSDERDSNIIAFDLLLSRLAEITRAVTLLSGHRLHNHIKTRTGKPVTSGVQLRNPEGTLHGRIARYHQTSMCSCH